LVPNPQPFERESSEPPPAYVRAGGPFSSE
jgi:hypothetical protein